MPRIIKSLPKKVNYLYTTEDVFGVHKLYKSKNNLYLVSTTYEGMTVRSYTVQDLQNLSSKFYDYAERYKHYKEEQDQNRES